MPSDGKKKKKVGWAGRKEGADKKMQWYKDYYIVLVYNLIDLYPKF